jgi:hypothetical protein
MRPEVCSGPSPATASSTLLVVTQIRQRRQLTVQRALVVVGHCILNELAHLLQVTRGSGRDRRTSSRTSLSTVRTASTGAQRGRGRSALGPQAMQRHLLALAEGNISTEAAASSRTNATCWLAASWLSMSQKGDARSLS